MIDGIGMERPHEADVIGTALCEARPDGADALSRFTPLLKSMLRREADQSLALQLGDLLTSRDAFGHRLAIHLGELGLVIERVEMTHPAGHVEPDDPFGFRRKMRLPDHPLPAITGSLGIIPLQQRRPQQTAESHPPDTDAGVVEE